MVSKRPENNLKLALHNYFETPNCVLTRSGSTAIILAMQVYDLTIGSEVIVPASCCPIVMYALQMAGYQVVLADVDTATLNSDVSHIKSVSTNQTRAILAVHAYGRVGDISNILSFAAQAGIVVIEDACLGYGGRFEGRPIGRLADISVISFGYDKPIDFGMGGALLLNDKRMRDKAERLLKENKFFQMPDSEHMLTSITDALMALPLLTEQRIENVKLVDANVSNPLFSKLRMPYQVNYWRYPLFIEPCLRARFIAYAKTRGQVFTCHFQSLGKLLTHSTVPNADYIGESIINLFVKPTVSESQLLKMISIVNEFHDDT
ncbi:DegT/DnrJ/EryC1/StrS family aminotransferase [Pseudoalteromonas aurantia]|uniref:Perosamine synthetase n=1 Tax=Pseudoalteromonas aurantia 208 TaxID=1314867 RepID=A0ABR9E8W5_9GAMM|nr:DegT/DnrJ/EryC1/StrS family aminotransferase [Pseudoalteromonas aurantia]MBE0367401.1 hypothetical protein [Pseudoalteromonas aurantia 208]